MIIIRPKLITLNEVRFICIWKVEHATTYVAFHFGSYLQKYQKYQCASFPVRTSPESVEQMID